MGLSQAPESGPSAATRSLKSSDSRWALHGSVVGKTPTEWLCCLQTSDQFQMEARRLQRELEVAVRQAQTAPSTHQMELRVREVRAVAACSDSSSVRPHMFYCQLCKGRRALQSVDAA